MKKTTLLALALAAAGSSAHAADLSYNYVQAGIISMDVNDLDAIAAEGGINPDLKGFNLKGSLAIGDSFYAFAGYRDADDSISDGMARVEFGLTQFNIGLGYRLEATENTDWLLEAEYIDDEISAKGSDGEMTVSDSFSDNGYRIATGLRGKASEKVELYGKITYSDVDQLGKGAGAQLGAVIGLNDTWGVTAEYQRDRRDGTDFSQFGLGVRASF